MPKRSPAKAAVTYSPGPSENTIRSPEGRVIKIPQDFELLPPGDAGLTRRVKAAGEHYVVAEKRGRRTFSRGVYAPSATIAQIRSDLEAERSTDAYARKQEASARRREKVQTEYVEDFRGSILAYLDFAPQYAEMAEQLADAVTAHATPVGSGTVARTKRIPIEDRARAAVIAWMRHQTTGYDDMVIPRVKGKRREVRRMLAERSKRLLARYRKGEPAGADCPLQKALSQR